MTNCPFLSTPGNDITCFKECAFYDAENIENCPFTQVKGNKKFDINKYLNFEIEEDTGEFDTDEGMDDEFADNEEDFFK